MDVKKIISCIAKRRKQLGLSLTDVANKIGYSSQSIHNWEKNKSLPDLYAIGELCKVYNLSIKNLLTCKTNKIENNEIKSFNIINFSNCLKLLRNTNKLTQQEFAKKIGVSYPTVIAWEKGKSTPNLKDFIKMCKVFSLNSNEFYYGQLKLDPDYKIQKRRKTILITTASVLMVAMAITTPFAIKMAKELILKEKIIEVTPEPEVEPPIVTYTITFLSDDNETVLHSLTFNENDHVTEINYIPSKTEEGKLFEFKGWDIDGDGVSDNIDIYMTKDFTFTAIFEEVPQIINNIEYEVEDYNLESVYLKSCLDLKGETEVTLPTYVNGKKVIGVRRNLFNKSSLIKKIIIPDGITEYDDYCFYNLVNLETIIFPPNANIIGRYAFKNDVSLLNVTLPTKLSSLTSNAFENCTALKTIDVSGLPTLQSNLFLNCSNLEEIVGLESVKSVCGNFASGTKIKSLTFTNNKMTIFENAFDNMRELETLDIQGSIYSLSDNLFKNCNKLEIIIYPVQIEHWWASKEAINGDCKDIYYRGTEGNFASIKFESEYKYGLYENKNIYFYSEVESNQSWRFVNNIPTKY